MACYINVFVCFTLFAAATSDGQWEACVIDDLPDTTFVKCRCVMERTEPNPKITKIKCAGNNFKNETALAMLTDLSDSDELLDSLQALTFTDNTIPVLVKNIIGNTKGGSFWNLDLFDLSNNSIKHISGKAFHSAPELQTLILSDNEWYMDGKSPRIFSSFFELKKLVLNNAFDSSDVKATDLQVAALSDVFDGSELYWLEELHLERNNLFTVKPQVFQSLPSLETLSLKNNQILNTEGIWNSTCHERTYFSDRRIEQCFLKTLDLSNNNIKTVSKSFIEELLKMKTFKDEGKLDISNNVLACDCHMQYFLSWLTKDNNVRYIVDADKLTCFSPPKLDGKKLVHLQEDDLAECGLKRSDMKQSTNAATIVISILLAVIGLVLIIVLFMNRETVKKKGGLVFSGVMNTFCPRKYRYAGVSV